MENKYFRPAGNLIDERSAENNFFKPAGDLVDTERKNVSEDKYFRTPGDLNVERNVTKSNLDEIKDYLLTVVSGKKYDTVCELGYLMESGRIIVGLKELMRMVDEGYNIVSAQVINAERDMIEIEFQKFKYDKDKMERWRRF